MEATAAGSGLPLFEGFLPGPLRAAKKITTLQINIGLVCNLACKHCHVESSPKRIGDDENMSFDWDGEPLFRVYRRIGQFVRWRDHSVIGMSRRSPDILEVQMQYDEQVPSGQRSGGLRSLLPSLLRRWFIGYFLVALVWFVVKQYQREKDQAEERARVARAVEQTRKAVREGKTGEAFQRLFPEDHQALLENSK